MAPVGLIVRMENNRFDVHPRLILCTKHILKRTFYWEYLRLKSSKYLRTFILSTKIRRSYISRPINNMRRKECTLQNATCAIENEERRCSCLVYKSDKVVYRFTNRSLLLHIFKRSYWWEKQRSRWDEMRLNIYAFTFSVRGCLVHARQD